MEDLTKAQRKNLRAAVSRALVHGKESTHLKDVTDAAIKRLAKIFAAAKGEGGGGAGRPAAEPVRLAPSKKSFKEALLGDDGIRSVLNVKEIEDIFNFKYHLKHVDRIFRRVGI